jgi:DNA-binding NarL/FixJ family response regulator
MMRDGLAATINAFADYNVAMECAHGEELMEAMAKAPPPLIAVVDLHMPVMDGYATIAWLRKTHPQVLPLALTFDATDEALVKAVRSGARGFLRKDARSAMLKHALDSLVLTGYFQNTESHDELLVPESARSRDDLEREDILDRITARERDMLRLVCDEREFTYDEIAKSLGISRNTLENHRVRLFEKFGIRSKTGLVLFATRWGLVDQG